MLIPFELNTEENKVIKEIVEHFENSTQKTMRVSKLVKVLRSYICNLPQNSLEVLDQLPQWYENSGMDFVEVEYLPRLISGWRPAIEDEEDLDKFRPRI